MKVDDAPRDALGWRRKYAVLVPSTNTIVQPEFDAMRPVGVTNHVSRIRIPNIALNNNADFDRLIQLIAAAQDEAVDAVMSCEPDQLVLGISVETFWNGRKASATLKEDLVKRTGLPVTMGAEACCAALDLFKAKRIAVLTPYQPIGDQNVVHFFEESGYEVRRIKGLCCSSPVATAQVSAGRLTAELQALDGDDVEALVQLGTNLAMVQVAAQAEHRLGKPVIAINAALYWNALRTAGIHDAMAGWGSLLEQH